MKKITTIAAALLMSTAFAAAQTRNTDSPTSGGAQPAQPGAQSGPSATPNAPASPNRARGGAEGNTGSGGMPNAGDRMPTDSETSGGATPVKPGAPGK